MIFEQDGLDLTDASLLADELGDTWLDFKASITDFNAYTFDTSYNLIKISDPQTSLGQTILEVLIDESTETTFKTNAVRNLLMTNIITITRDFGITLDEDILTIDELPKLNKIIDLIYTLDGFEDLLSLSEVLESTDIPTVDRFIRIFSIINDTDDLEDYEHLILDVSSRTLETLRKSLIVYDELPEVQQHVIKRITPNRPFIKPLLAGRHIVEGGNVGGSFHVLLDGWKQELLAVEEKSESDYVKEVIGFALISDLTNANILNEINNVISTVIFDPAVIFKADKMIESLNLESTDD